MKEWHFNVLFFVGVGGAVYTLFAPGFLEDNPQAVAGVGLILAYVLSQKPALVKSKPKELEKREAEADDDKSDADS